MHTMTDIDRHKHEVNRHELVERLTHAMPNDGISEPTPGLLIARASQPMDGIHNVSKPSLCLIAQGAKELSVGDNVLRYDPDHYLIATMQVPVTGRIVEASPERPYLTIRLDLDAALIGSVMVEAGLNAPKSHADAKALYISELDGMLLDAVVRLVQLADSSEEACVLIPLVKREIAFRLLMGRQGNRLRHLPMLGAQSYRIAKAVEKLRREFDQPISIDGLAKDLGMSSSGFHHHFKTVMDMSPLQYQKLIRLQEARQLMLGQSLDASSAGYRVGYDDPSHFSKDYKKRFGISPMRDVEKLRAMVQPS